jgi:four helix bundle protein
VEKGLHNFGFEKLEIWQKAIELAFDIKMLVKKFPNEELFQLTSQIRRSSKSISANIAESTGRTTKKDKARFITFAYSSGLETVDHLIFSFKCGWIYLVTTKL